MDINKYLTFAILLFVFISCSLDENITESGDLFILVLDSEIELDLAEQN